MLVFVVDCGDGGGGDGGGGGGGDRERGWSGVAVVELIQVVESWSFRPAAGLAVTSGHPRHATPYHTHG